MWLVRRADNLATFMCWSRPVMGWVYLYLYQNNINPFKTQNKLYLKILSAPRSKQIPSHFIKPNQLIFCREIIDDCTEIHTIYSGTSVHELNPFLEAVREPKCS
jgi:hypothetical protein